MRVRQFVGVVLVVIGVMALVWGGIFWVDRDTVIDAGPFEVTAEEREGVAVPPLLGVVFLVGGIALLVVSRRTRA